jgi:ClpP class serine protease
VDEIGGFQDALQRAREEAGLRDDGSVTFVTYSARLGPNREAMKRSIRAVADTLGLEPPVKPGIPEIAELQALEQLLRLGDDRVWAMMPMELEVR